MSDACELLSALVDTLISAPPGGDPAPAYLIQKNRADAVLVLRDSMNALVLLADAAPGDALAARVQAALAAERPEVRAGVGEAVRFLVLVGTPVPAHTPTRLPAGVFELLAVSRDASGFLATSQKLLTPDEIPRSRAIVLQELEAARLRARRDTTALPAATLARVEQEGEAALAAEGVYAAGLIRSFGVATILVVSILMFVLQLRMGGFEPPIALRMGANLGRLVAQGEWERVLTAGYLHFGFVHFATNMVVLYVVGVFVEAALGPARFIALYTAIVAGAEAVTAWARPEQVGAGSSGGILGLIAALAVLASRKPSRVPPISGKANSYAAGIYLSLQLFYSLKPGVSFVAHAAGALVGAVLTWSGIFQLGLPALDSGKREPGWSRAYGIALACCAVLITGIAFERAFTRGRPWEGIPPPRLEPGVLAQTGLRGRFPAGSVDQMLVTTGDIFVKYRLGDYDTDPLVISLIDRAHDVPDHEGEVALRHLRDAIQAGKDSGKWSTPVIKPLGSRQGARCVYSRYGTNLVRWVFGVGGRELDVQISWIAPATEEHVARAEECLASLERDRR